MITAGRAFAADAVPLTSEFQKHEMPASFVDELNADIAVLEEAISGQTRTWWLRLRWTRPSIEG